MDEAPTGNIHKKVMGEQEVGAQEGALDIRDNEVRGELLAAEGE